LKDKGFFQIDKMIILNKKSVLEAIFTNFGIQYSEENITKFKDFIEPISQETLILPKIIS